MDVWNLHVIESGDEMRFELLISFFDFNRLKIASIRKVSNENIRPPENQKYWFSGIPSRKKYSDVIYPPPRGFSPDLSTPPDIRVHIQQFTELIP